MFQSSSRPVKTTQCLLYCTVLKYFLSVYRYLVVSFVLHSTCFVCFQSINQSVNQSFLYRANFTTKVISLHFPNWAGPDHTPTFPPWASVWQQLQEKKKCILTCRNFEQKRTQWSVVCLLCSPAASLVSQTVQVITWLDISTFNQKKQIKLFHHTPLFKKWQENMKQTLRKSKTSSWYFFVLFWFFFVLLKLKLVTNFPICPPHKSLKLFTTTDVRWTVLMQSILPPNWSVALCF